MIDNTKTRYFHIDAVKAFAIFLVLWGHVLQYCGTHDGGCLIVHDVIYSFHMPLFMMVSGLFATKSMNLTFKDVVIKKFQQLIVPFIAGCFLILIETICIGSFIGFGVFFTHYWFLKSLFICYLLLWIGIYIIRLVSNANGYNNRQYLMGGGISLIISQFVLVYNVNIMFPAFLLGFIIAIFGKLNIVNNKIVAIGSLSIYAIIYLLLENIEITIPILTNCMKIIRGLAGACFIVVSFNALNRVLVNSRVTHIVSEIGQNTLGIYVLQTIVLEIAIAHYIGNSVAIDSSYIFPLIMAPLLAIIVLTITMKLISFINCNEILSKLLLGKNSSGQSKGVNYGFR